MDKRHIKKVNTDEIEGEYILKNTDPDKKKIIFSTVIWYDPETKKYYFKSESDMNGNRLAGQVVSHKLMQDLLSISKWMLKPLGELWDDPSRVHSGGIDTEKMAVDWKLGWKPKKQNKRALKSQDDQKKDDADAKYAGAPYKWSEEYEEELQRALKSQDAFHYAGPKYAGAPYNRERDEDDIRRALKRQDDQKKAEPKKPKRWGKRKLTPAQREERDKELAAIKREGCCAKCRRRITPESQSTFDEHYVCKWCDQKNHTNCKENEYSDFAKEDSK